MHNVLPEKIRDFINAKDENLADKADSFWRISEPIHDKQSRPNSNENGRSHVEMVEHNAWRLIKESGRVSDFNPCELFILSCGACCHDFDKGLFDNLPKDVSHGEGSGQFLTQEFKVFLQSFHEAAAIKKIVGIHDLPDDEFLQSLKGLEKKFGLGKWTINLNKLAVILKTADILHTDSSRIAQVGIDLSLMTENQKNKHFARESISGWYIDGSRIIINAMPRTLDHLDAVEGCKQYIIEKEWPAVSEKLSDYGFPFELDFKIDKSCCGEPKDKKKAHSASHAPTPGSKYSKDNYVFNVPYRQKGEGVVGRESSLTQLFERLAKSNGTAIGQAASFHGMGGLGKTQLAVEYAYRYKEKYPKGVIWISADQDIDSQLIHISKEAGWIAPESEHSIILGVAIRRLKTYSECLIVFDNVEKFEQIKAYLPEQAASPHLLLTSRMIIKSFEPIEIDVLGEDDAFNLLILESGRDFHSLSIEEKDAAKSITRDLGFLPLAIEIAGAYLKYLKEVTFEEYYKILSRSITTALKGDFYSGYTNHESDLRSTLNISESLSDNAPLLKDILNVLTWSGSSFMRASLLAAILDAPEDELIHSLNLGTELRIFRKDESRKRYEIHRLLRKVRQDEYVLEQNIEWAEKVIYRLGSWFEARRENFSDLSDFEAEIDHLKQWYENSEKINCDQSPRLLWLQAYPFYHWGKYNQTHDLVKTALDLYEKNSGADSPLKAHLLNDLGGINNHLGAYQIALQHQESSLRIREILLGENHPDTASSLNNIGFTFRKLGKHQKALEYQECALKIRKEKLGTDHPDTATSLNDVGLTYGELGDYEKALEYQECALKIRKEKLGTDHPDTATSLNDIGLTYGGLRDHEKKLEYHEAALKIFCDKFGPDHPTIAASANNVGVTYAELGNHEKALEYQERALKIWNEQLGPDHPETAICLNNIGVIYRKIGKYVKTLEYQERALKIHEEQLGFDHPHTVISAQNVILALLKIKKFSNASSLLKRFQKHLSSIEFEYYKARINSESMKSGFRTQSTIQENKKKKNKAKKR